MLNMQAPLGVILKNEDKLDEIIDILSGIHHYMFLLPVVTVLTEECFTRSY